MKFSSIFFLLAFSLRASAQLADSTAVSMMPPTSPLEKIPPQFLYLDITSSYFNGAPLGIETQPVSVGFNIDLEYEFKIVGHAFAFAPGISYSAISVKSNGALNYIPSIDGKSIAYSDLVAIPDSIDYSKNKFSFSYIDVPLEFRIRTKPKDGHKAFFFFSPGFRAGLEVSEFWKQVINDQYDDRVKTKTYNIKNVSPYHYGVSLRMGYYKFGVYGFYSLSSLFEKNHGPDVKPFSVGITFTPL